mgnify:CR=1 FL=1
MYSKVYNLKFPSMDEAKIGVSYLSEDFGGSISDFNILSLNILLDKCGVVAVTVKFDTLEEMAAFVKEKQEVFESLKKSFCLRYTELSAVAVYSFEREASSVV